MTTHELARQLLARPEEPVGIYDPPGNYYAYPIVVSGRDENGLPFTGLAGSQPDSVWYYSPIRPQGEEVVCPTAPIQT